MCTIYKQKWAPNQRKRYETTHLNPNHRKHKPLLLQKYRRDDKDESESEDSDYVPYVPVKERKKQQLMKLGRLGQLREAELNKPKSSSENETNGEEDDDEQAWGRKNNISLLDQHTELKKIAEGLHLIIVLLTFCDRYFLQPKKLVQ